MVEPIALTTTIPSVTPAIAVVVTRTSTSRRVVSKLETVPTDMPRLTAVEAHWAIRNVT